jgi:hypothetical protein
MFKPYLYFSSGLPSYLTQIQTGMVRYRPIKAETWAFLATVASTKKAKIPASPALWSWSRFNRVPLV